MTPAGPIADVRWRPWRIPLRDPLATGAGDLTVREGLVVRIETADGAIGLGESAPLPAEGLTVRDLGERVAEVGRALVGRSPADAWPLSPGKRLPGADVGIETALAGLLAGSCGTPLAHWLADQAGLAPPPPAPIPVNALLGADFPDALAREARAAIECGFGTVKVKVGRDLAADGERLRAVCAALGPNAELRIDANGAWNEREAVEALTAHATHRVGLCEQPVPPGPDASASLARVRAASPIPIAADESCASLADFRALLDADAVDAIVIKPLRTGLAAALAMIGEAAARNVCCILTTTFDTGIGTALAVHLAALLPEPRPACGLATLPMLAGDIVRGCPTPHRGAPSRPPPPRHRGPHAGGGRGRLAPRPGGG
ncbi:MAG: o-succinylbenzoate synthase, partial [Dehalococcoidia bacterium]|nr:o-succinylbenzoate synthase [Dehalococcoidia bacterium]